jgi:Bacterial TSP3 repeat
MKYPPRRVARTLASHLRCGMFVCVMFASTRVDAKPAGQKLFCDVYPTSPACNSGETTCATCHALPPALNPFGSALSAKLLPGAARPLSDSAFSAGLPDALRQVDALDADGDGASNGDELRAGTDPVNAQSKPNSTTCVPNAGANWNFCAYDIAYAFRKVSLDFCGRSATYDERQAFAASGSKQAVLHAKLDDCLKSEFWRGRNGEVWNLGSPKIRPIQSIKGGQDAGPVPLADYYRDYAMYVYATTGDRDARDLLRASYLVDVSFEGPTTYTKVSRTFVEDLAVRNDPTSVEAVAPERRAGMLTSAWFRTINTMFTAVPRTTAAQAYRSYLGLDIALLNGLKTTNAAEPLDYDRKGVRAAGCISCHSTLDPLSYPFSRYEGIDADERSFAPVESVNAYRPDRMARFVASGESPELANVPEAGYILGKPVKDLVEWGRVASDSDEFAQKTILDFWRLLLGAEPRPNELAAYTRLWQRFRNENAYQVEKTLHDLIDTEAYGAP